MTISAKKALARKGRAHDVVREHKAIVEALSKRNGKRIKEATHADILVTSCYKWLLSTHGVAIFYWNRKRLPHLEPPFLGWHTGVTIPEWQNPTSFTLRPNADRFEAGNVSFISTYILENALDASWILEFRP